jgi:uncharacterized repeat protein (TIGR02543 family)
MKKTVSVLLALMFVLGMLVVTPVSVSAKNANDSDVFLKQQTDYTCTLSSVAMLLRRRAIIDGKSNWSSITESSISSAAWINNAGLKGNFWYDDMHVVQVTMDCAYGQEINWLQSYLNSHPEGVVVYNSYNVPNQPHAVLVTSISNGTVYCADPWYGVAGGIIPIANSALVGSGQSGKLYNLSSIWYISNKSGGSVNHTPAPVRPTVTGTANIAVREIASLTWNRPANTTSFWVDIWHNGKQWANYDTNYTAFNAYFGTETGQWQFFVYAKGPGGTSANYQFNVNVAQSDYIPKKTIVYNNHVYSIYDIGTSWFVARDIAEQMGGHLVTINTVEERNKIIELLASGGKSWYWTDAIDGGTEGTWRWSTGETKQALDWITGQPDNANSDVGWGSENFAAIYKANGKLNDLPNGTSEIAYGGFIVEVDDYSYLPSVTYNGHKYLRMDDVPDGGMTWKAAKSFAERMGGHLATITSAAELEAVKPLLAQGTKNGYLIGATDEAKEGTWTWATGEAFSYKNWAPGEPNNHLGAQHFTQIYKNGTWDDVHDSTESVTCGILVEIEPTKTAAYNGSKYQLFEQQMTWKDAQAYCESIGGHLATVTSAGEQAVIEKLAASGSSNGYYIGLTNEVKGGDWRWTTSETFSYNNWCVEENEPANTYGLQNYGLLYHTDKVSMKWHDIENYRQGFGFVCEFDNVVKYTVKFDSQGGSAAATKSLSYNAAIGALPTPTRMNYTFKGWYTAASGGTKITKDTKITKSVTFYAQWESVSATAIALNSTAAATLGVGQTTTRTATITPANATDKTISWTSSNTAVATVSGGKVTAVAAGTATITAQTSNGKTASFKVTIKPAPTKIAYKTASATIGAGETYATGVTLTPTNAQTTRTYTSSNTKVATVDTNGKITGKAAGIATITVKTYNGKTASFKVTIKPAPTKIALSKAVTLGVGEKYQTSVTLTPTNAQTTRTYSSSNTKVATVDSAGKITAKAVGTAKITVKSYNGKTSTITVTVKAAPSKVTLRFCVIL